MRLLSFVFLVSLSCGQEAVAGPLRSLNVDIGNTACSDSYTETQAQNNATPFCTLQRAAMVVVPGDEVVVAAGSYPGDVRWKTSGTAIDPITVRAAVPGTVTVNGTPGIAATMRIDSAGFYVLKGITINGGDNQAVYLKTCNDVTFDNMTIELSRGSGFAVGVCQNVVISNSVIRNNATTGVMETGASSNNQIIHNVIESNGKSSLPNGDGIQTGGTSQNLLIEDNQIRFNGDNTTLEHGIYVGKGATGYRIINNRFQDNAASQIKAASNPGVITGNILYSTVSGYGIYMSDHSAARSSVQVCDNYIYGSYSSHAIATSKVSDTINAVIANNTVINSSTATGNPSALKQFEQGVALLSVYNNVLAANGASNARAIVAPGNPSFPTGTGNSVFNSNYLVTTSSTVVVSDGASRNFAYWQGTNKQDAMGVAGSVLPTIDVNGMAIAPVGGSKNAGRNGLENCD